MKNDEFMLGCEVFAVDPPNWLRSARVGLLANQASVSRSFEHVRELVQKAGGRLTCLFAPQHGFFSDKQANMIESSDAWDVCVNIPVFSLYGRYREPTPDMLDHVDVLIVDLQDVGTRVYTYCATMGLCMEAAARRGVKVVIMDRPNPVNGRDVEGNVLNLNCRSFVGRYPIPMRHGLTLGEMARFIAEKCGVDCDLEVVLMRGWKRGDCFDATGMHWSFPSPNMPAWMTTLLYPGMVLLEGTNVSEGRGTTLPFHLFGAPFIDQAALARYMKDCGVEGVVFRPVSFEPVFEKWHGHVCRGFELHVTDQERFRPYRTALALIQGLQCIHGDRFRLLPPPYEYEYEKLPLDILLGDVELRKSLMRGDGLPELEAGWAEELNGYLNRREDVLLYPV